MYVFFVFMCIIFYLLFIICIIQGVKSYTVKLESKDSDDFPNETWYLNDSQMHQDTIVKSFSWAQWDPVHQVIVLNFQ